MDKFLNRIGLYFLFTKNKKNTIQDIQSLLRQTFITNDVEKKTKGGKEDTNEEDILKFNLTQYRSSESFNEQTKKILNMITSGKDIQPVGSLKYTVHRYPGDIDIYEEIKSCCSLKEASIDIKQKIQVIAKKIFKEPLMYMADFKAGLDDRYNIEYIGTIDKNNHVTEYDADKIKQQFIKLKEDSLLHKKEFLVGLELIKDNPTKKEWDALYEYIKSFYIVRWNLEDLLLGYKILRPNTSQEKKLKLEDAIQSKSTCKLDLWAPIDGRYIEITNFLVFIYVDDKGEEHIINMNIEDYILSLVKDLKKYGSEETKNYLKYAKRLWSLANTLEEKKKLKKLFPLFSSGAAILYQISAEIEILINILEEVEDKPLTKKQFKKQNKLVTKKLRRTMEMNLHETPIPIIIKQIENFKSRIGLVYEHFDESQTVFNLINNITHFYYSNNKKYLNKKEKRIIIDNLEQIKTIVDEYVNDYAKTFLIKHNLYDINQYNILLSELK